MVTRPSSKPGASKHFEPGLLYRDHFAVKSYKTNPEKYDAGYGQTTCMDVHPRQLIQPYLHYEQFPLTGYKSCDDVFNKCVISC